MSTMDKEYHFISDYHGVHSDDVMTMVCGVTNVDNWVFPNEGKSMDNTIICADCINNYYIHEICKI